MDFPYNSLKNIPFSLTYQMVSTVIAWLTLTVVAKSKSNNSAKKEVPQLWAKDSSSSNVREIVNLISNKSIAVFMWKVAGC